jgi:hypothetical protein
VVSVAGTWKLSGSRIQIVVKGAPTNGGRLQVDGANLSASNLTVTKLGVPVDEQGVGHVLVHRTGVDEVTFRDDSPGAETFTCTKQ